ncbi:MAG TPA: hypothetical protein VN635_11695 [Conexibacter sp.]|nr:hypothetical protein [Conexibacter sp.]
MAKQPITVDFDADLLEELRAEEPGKADRELREVRRGLSQPYPRPHRPR